MADDTSALPDRDSAGSFIMDLGPLNYPVLLGFFLVFQIVLGAWSFAKTGSGLLGVATLVLPPVGIPVALYLLREGLKDNQVGGAVTYLSVVAGVIFFLWKLPSDETPWLVIFTMEIFAGIAVLNIIDLAVTMKKRSHES